MDTMYTDTSLLPPAIPPAPLVSPAATRAPSLWTALGLIALYFILQVVGSTLLALILGMALGFVHLDQGMTQVSHGIRTMLEQPGMQALLVMLTLGLAASSTLLLAQRRWSHLWSLAQPPGFGFARPSRLLYIALAIVVGVGCAAAWGAVDPVARTWTDGEPGHPATWRQYPAGMAHSAGAGRGESWAHGGGIAVPRRAAVDLAETLGGGLGGVDQFADVCAGTSAGPAMAMVRATDLLLLALLLAVAAAALGIDLGQVCWLTASTTCWRWWRGLWWRTCPAEAYATGELKPLSSRAVSNTGNPITPE